jgi:hypothetical protein
MSVIHTDRCRIYLGRVYVVVIPQDFHLFSNTPLIEVTLPMLSIRNAYRIRHLLTWVSNVLDVVQLCRQPFRAN